MEENNMLLSIIIPLYNAEKYFSELMDSLIKQITPEIEILLINDGSTDNTERLCLEYKESGVLDNLVYLKKQNGGVCSARNAGLEIAKGRYVTFADQDDWWEPCAINNLLTVAKENIVDLLIFEPYVSQNVKVRKRLKLPVKDGIYTGNDMFEQIVKPFVFGLKDDKGNGFNFGLWNCMFNNSFLKANNIKLDPYLRMGEDIVFISQVLGVCKNVQTMSKTLYNWRDNQGSVSHTYVKASELSVTKTLYINHKIEEALDNYDSSLWETNIHPKYAHLVLSMARNWTHPMCDEKVSAIRNMLEVLYKNQEIGMHIDAMNVHDLSGRRKFEMIIIKTKNITMVILYAKFIHFVKRIKLFIKKVI